MKWYLHWLPENVTKVKETLSNGGKDALKFLQTILGCNQLESVEVRRIKQAIDLVLDNLWTKKGMKSNHDITKQKEPRSSSGNKIFENSVPCRLFIRRKN